MHFNACISLGKAFFAFSALNELNTWNILHSFEIGLLFNFVHFLSFLICEQSTFLNSLKLIFICILLEIKPCGAWFLNSRCGGILIRNRNQNHLLCNCVWLHWLCVLHWPKVLIFKTKHDLVYFFAWDVLFDDQICSSKIEHLSNIDEIIKCLIADQRRLHIE